MLPGLVVMAESVGDGSVNSCFLIAIVFGNHHNQCFTVCSSSQLLGHELQTVLTTRDLPLHYGQVGSPAGFIRLALALGSKSVGRLIKTRLLERWWPGSLLNELSLAGKARIN